MGNTSRILVVEDDAQVRAMVATLLGRAGYEVDAVPRAGDMRRALSDRNIDLILLDVLLPDGDGFEALRRLRETSDLPVIMLTGVDGPDDRVHGLESGADDYVCKPFDPNELIARVRSVLRRADGAGRVVDPSGASTVYSFAGLDIDATRRSVTGRDGRDIELTAGEFDLLLALAEAPNRPLSRDELLDRTRSREWSPYDRSIDVLIGRLRKKIEENPAKPALIKTVRTVGYVLSAQVMRRQLHRVPLPAG